MHILNRYALSCGVKIDKPFVFEHYYPITLDKYIVFQTSGKGNSRQYDYWSKVFRFIKQYAPDYKIVHVGLPTDQSVAGCDLDLRGKTSLKHLPYIIKNSSIYLGVDSLSVHFASHFDKKMVVLYSYCYAQNSAPVWGNPDNQVLIEPDWAIYGKPSFSFNEEKKNINTIKPEKIAKAVLDQLNIKNDLDKVETIFMGRDCHKPVIEIVPNSLPKLEILKDKICNIRMDYHFNEKILQQICQITNINLITNKEINLNLIAAIKDRIVALMFIVDKNTNINYIEGLKSLGINFTLVADDNAQWNDLAEIFFDFGLSKDEVFQKNEIKTLDNVDKNHMFESEKILLSDGKVYSCKLFWEKDIPKFTKASPVPNDTLFWEDAEHFYIYKDERSKSN